MGFWLNNSRNPGENFDLGNVRDISLLYAVAMALTVTEASLRKVFNYFEPGNSGKG